MEEIGPGLVELEVAVPRPDACLAVGVGRPPKATQHRQGTTVTKDYQTEGFDTSALAVPEQVSVAMAEIAKDMREGLLALAVGAGLQ